MLVCCSPYPALALTVPLGRVKVSQSFSPGFLAKGQLRRKNGVQRRASPALGSRFRPGQVGGNLDLRHRTIGSTLYLPVIIVPVLGEGRRSVVSFQLPQSIFVS